MSDKLDLILQELKDIKASQKRHEDMIVQLLDIGKSTNKKTVEIQEDTDIIKEKQAHLESQMNDVATTTAFVVKDVYMLKNRAK